jgi:hypothetical protein
MDYNFNKFIEGIIEKVAERLFYKIIDKLNNSKTNSEETLLLPDEACEFLRIKNSTLWRWVQSGTVNQYGLKGKRYYKKSELVSALQKLNTYHDGK